MKQKKIVRYRLGVSRVFPATHPRKGEETNFDKKIHLTLMRIKSPGLSIKATTQEGEELCPKIHTIRANYPLWERRMKKVQAGEAVIELYYWQGKPYDSKQIVFAILDKDSGCGVQKLEFLNGNFSDPVIMESQSNPYLTREALAKNDGLSLEDFKAWFKGYDLSKPMAIIQFTEFRY